MPHVPGSDSNTYTFNLDQPSPFHTHSHTRLDGERALSHTSVLIIHPTKKLDPYRFVVKFVPNDLDETNSKSFKLILVSNQLNMITFELHTISWFLCWMIKRYTCIQKFSIS